VDRIAASGPGRVEIAGRWFGVRGRVFVRPTLTLQRTPGAGEVRALADLAHKPWAAQDGDPWLAAFDVDVDLNDVSEVELSVAPDIAVALRRKGRAPAGPGDRLAAGDSARTPVAKAEDIPQPRRRRVRGAEQEMARVSAQLAAAMQALALERERRAAVDQALEDERAVARELRTELGKIRADLELAQAGAAQAAAMTAELDAARRELYESRRRHDTLSHQRDETTQAHAAITTELHERTGALESAREALAREQAETERLRGELAKAEKAAARDASRAAHAGPGAATRTAEGGRGASGRSSQSRAETGRHDRADGARREHGATPSTSDASRRTRQAAPDPVPRTGSSTSGYPHRPLNPSLRHRTWWLGRLLVVVFILVVLAAIYLVIHSTITH
jgi:hypothetical protein